MIKTGIVMSIMNKKAGIMTSSGEFVYIKVSKLPNIGEIHTGELYKKNSFLFKYALTAASLMFMFISSVGAYAYYTPVTSIVLSIKPSVSLKANRWNKIISVKALNSDGSLILSNIKLKNKSIDSALELLVKEAKTENFINKKYVKDKNTITVDIISDKNNAIDISNFKNTVDTNNLNVKINASSGNNKIIDITVNNKKIDISNLSPESNKKENTNKMSNTKKDILKRPSVDSNTNKTEDKSYEIKKQSKNSDKTTINRDGELGNKNPNNNLSAIKKGYTSSGITRNGQDKER